MLNFEFWNDTRRPFGQCCSVLSSWSLGSPPFPTLQCHPSCYYTPPPHDSPRPSICLDGFVNPNVTPSPLLPLTGGPLPNIGRPSAKMDAFQNCIILVWRVSHNRPPKIAARTRWTQIINVLFLYFGIWFISLSVILPFYILPELTLYRIEIN